MPKSKRSKVVTLTKTAKKSFHMQEKQALLEKVRDAMDKYEHVFVVKVEHMRNACLKQVRELFKQSCEEDGETNMVETGKIFYGRNKIMMKALGSSEDDEYKSNMRLIAEKLHGHVGLVCTSMSAKELENKFKQVQQTDYARAGCMATQTIVIPTGIVTRSYNNQVVEPADREKFPHNMEPQLRALGMPTRLVQGNIMLDRDYTLCEQGKKLTANQAHLLKHFYIPMAEFKVQLLYQWSNGVFTQLADDAELDALEDVEQDEESDDAMAEREE